MSRMRAPEVYEDWLFDGEGYKVLTPTKKCKGPENEIQTQNLTLKCNSKQNQEDKHNI